MPDCGDARTEPERAERLAKPWGDVRLDREYRFGREKTEGNPDGFS